MSGRAFIPVDQAVRDEIRTALDETLMVEAGAGTGKTTVLVARIVELLRRGPHSVDEIAVMTFTEPAAAELASRVREGLEQAMRETDDEIDRARLRAALAGLHRMRIETIHAFAANVLRERPVEAGLDPQFEVLDELGARLAFDRSYEAWLAELLKADRAEVTTALHRGMETKHLRQIAMQLHEHRYALPLAPIVTGKSGAVSEFATWVKRGTPAIGALTDRCIDEENKAYLNGRRMIEFAAQLEIAAKDEDPVVFERTVLFRAPKFAKGAGNATGWHDPQDTRDLKSLFGEYLELRSRAQAELRTEAIAGVLPLIEEFVLRFEGERRGAGTAEFDDLLLWARDLVRDKPDVRAYFHRRFPRILVDEFQDTDPIQAELVIRIAAGEPADDWTTLVPRRGHLFVVGDPKQSIYRFRRADIAIYDELRRGSLAAGVRHITQNFRSVKTLLDWANKVFDLVLVEQPGVQPGNVHLHPVPQATAETQPAVVAVHGSGNASLKAEDVRAEEGRVLARTIDRAVRQDRWLVRDRRDGTTRPCEWRDIAILVPSRTDIEAYTEPLQTLDIPFRMEGGTHLYGRQEVRDLIACLHAIDDPSDRISLVTALRSMACGCSDEDIFTWVASGSAVDLRFRLNGHEGPVADGLRLLASLRRERRGLSLGELVSRVITRTKLVEVALAEPDGEQSAANLLKVVDQARAFTSSGGGGLRPFTRWLADRREEEGEEEEAGVHEEADDVIRIVTIHSSKGLEFPIVALAKPNTNRPNDSGPVADAKTHRIELKVGDFQTPGYTDAMTQEKVLGDAERRRLLYVAVTRTRDHLIVPMITALEKRGGMLNWLTPALPEWEEERAGGDVDGCVLYDRRLVEDPEDQEQEERIARSDEHDKPSDAEIDGGERQRAAWVQERDQLLELAGRELEVVTASSVELLWQRPLTVEVSESDGTVLAAGNGPPLPLGDAVHQVMEVVDLAHPGSIDQIVAAVCSESGLTDRQDEVSELVRRCLASPVIGRAISAGEYWREVPFTIPWDGGRAVGRIDLMFVEDEKIVIVDYKTDDVTHGLEAAVNEHLSQAEVYAAAARQTTSIDVAEVVFVFCRLGQDGACRWD